MSKDKVALIIGAGDYLGSAIARRFAKEGYHAVGTRRRGDIESWKEYGWYCSRSIASASASGLTCWGGCNLGAAVGTTFGPAGTIAGAIIGGLIGSILGGTISSKAFERIWSNPVCTV